jgi:hypothetical protein
MNMLVRKTGLFFVLLAGTFAASANPGQAKGEQEIAQAASRQQDGGEKSEPRAGRSFQSPEVERSPEEGYKKHSRLSPEERRILRRQINEAGQDLYIRKP